MKTCSNMIIKLCLPLEFAYKDSLFRLWPCVIKFTCDKRRFTNPILDYILTYI